VDVDLLVVVDAGAGVVTRGRVVGTTVVRATVVGVVEVTTGPVVVVCADATDAHPTAAATTTSVKATRRSMLSLRLDSTRTSTPDPAVVSGPYPREPRPAGRLGPPRDMGR